jgi:F420-non-reducing hydrogenase small subunit
MKARVATEWLSGCSGCHVAVVDLHEKLLGLVEDVEFVRVPVLMDEKGYPAADVGIVEGAIRSEHDRECAHKMRSSCKKIVAFGSCAAYGGPSGLGWLYDKKVVLDKVYGSGHTNVPGQHPSGDLPHLEEGVVPLDDVIDVDFYLPGCPPHPLHIAAALRTLLGAPAPALTTKSVCAECTRKMRKREGVTLKTTAVTASDAELCFLSQGVVCLGSVTLNRCQAPCPASGIACTGCAGPSLNLVKEPHLDLRTMVARRMSLLTGIEADSIRRHMEQDAKTYYAYAAASPAIYKKPTVELREWAGDAAPALAGKEA